MGLHFLYFEKSSGGGLQVSTGGGPEPPDNLDACILPCVPLSPDSSPESEGPGPVAEYG
jgi:hypothetical protein